MIVKTSNKSQSSKANQPVLFALQAIEEAVVPNILVSKYEEKLGEELGVLPEDVHLRSSGTTTSSGDSKEDD